MAIASSKGKKNWSVFVQIIRDVIAQGDVFIGPFMVFITSCAHYIFFTDTSSLLFILVAMIGLLFVMGFSRVGLFLACLFELIFFAFIAIEQPDSLLSQLGFLVSLAVAFSATFVSAPKEAFLSKASMYIRKSTPYTAVARNPDEYNEQVREILRQKERLWQQLFDARQEITRLYQQKKSGKSATVASKAVYNSAKIAEQKMQCVQQFEELKVKQQKNAHMLHNIQLFTDKAYTLCGREKDKQKQLFALLEEGKKSIQEYAAMQSQEVQTCQMLIDKLFSLLS